MAKLSDAERCSTSCVSSLDEDEHFAEITSLKLKSIFSELQEVVLEQVERGRVTSGASNLYQRSSRPRVCLEHIGRISKLEVFVPWSYKPM